MAAILPPTLAPDPDAGSPETSRRNVAVPSPHPPATAAIPAGVAIDWRDEATALTRAAAEARDRATAAGLWAEAAAVHAAHGSAEAAQLAHRALAFVPSHAAASLVLSDALSKRGDREGSRAVLTAAWRAHPGDERISEALEAWCEEAHDWAALDALLVARLGPEAHLGGEARRDVLLRLARIRAARGDHAGQVEALERLGAAEDAMEAAERARAWLGAAALRAARLSDPAGAFRCAAEAMRLVPADAETRKAGEEFARAAGREQDLYTTFDAIARELSDAPEEERAVRLRAAALAERQGRLHDAAARHYERVLELAPSDAEALAGLTRLAVAAGSWDRAASLLRARAAAAPTAERAALLEKLADILLQRLHDAAGAVTACREALGHATSDEQRRRLARALPALCEAAGDHAGRLAALDALPADERDPRATIAALQALASETQAGADRARIEARVADIAERELGQSALALAALTRAVRACPELDAPRRELARVASEVGCLADRARILADVAVAAPVHVGAEIWRELAQAREELGDAASAADAWEQVRRRAPEDGEALSALARLYESLDRFAELASVLAARRASGASDPATAARLAELLALRLSLPRQALPLAAEALRQDPASAPARRATVALAARSDELGRKAFALAERALERATAAEATAAWLSIARGSGSVEAWRRTARSSSQSGERAAARLAWLEVLERRPGDGEAALQLDALLGDDDPAAQRARIAWLALDASNERSPEALERCARLAAAAGDARAAAHGWAEVLRLAPNHARAHDALLDLSRSEDADVATAASVALEDALRRTGHARRLATLLEVRLEKLAPAEGGARGAILEELAGLCERLGDVDAAAARWREAAAARSTARAWGAVARIERRRGAWPALVEALTRVAASSESSRERTEAWCEVASVMETRLGDREGAVESWRRALAENPEDGNALRELSRLLGATERWAELADVLARQAALAERRPNRVAEGADLRMRAAQIRHERLGDAAGAFQLYRGVLERMPSHRDAIDALHALARAGSLDAAAEVEPLHERAGDVARWAEVLEVRASATADARARAALRLRIASLHESAGAPRAAFDAALKALHDDPESVDAMSLAERVAEGRDDELAAALAASARRARDPEARLALQRRLARRARGAADAAVAWAEVVALAPGDREALAGLVASHRAAGNVAALADALRARIAVEHDAPTRATLLAELADAEERRGDLEAAAGALRARLDLHPDDGATLGALDRVLEAAGRVDELGEVLAREIALAERAGDRERVNALRFRLAELRAERRGDRAGALAVLEQILAEDPGHDGALARLEAMLEEQPGDERVAAVLARAHEQGRRWDGLAAVLEVHAPELASAEQRKALLVRLASVRERQLGNAELAFVALSRAFAEDPADAALRQELTRVAAATGQDEELLATLEEALDRTAGAAAFDLLATLGQVCADRVGAPERAVEWWMRAWRTDPARAGSLVPRLERLCVEHHRHAELCDLLEWRAAQGEGTARADLLDRTARIRLEQLGEAEGAIALWRDAVMADPHHLGALRSLARAGEERGQAAALLGFAEALVAAGLHQEASDAARRVLALERLSAPELERLAVVCGEAGARVERAQVSERKAAALEDVGVADDAAQAWRDAGAEWEALGNADAAAAALEKALAIAGDDPTFEKVRDLHRSRGAWRDHARVSMEHAERVQDPAARAALLADAARTQEQRLAERELAFFSWCRVLSHDPAHREASECAERLAAEAGAWDDLAAVWEQIADATSGAMRCSALAALARVRERTGEEDAARAALTEALRADPAAVEPLERLTASLSSAGRWQEALAALALARDASEPERAASLQRRIAELTEANLSDPEAAIAAWRELKQRDAASGAALDALERLLAELNRWEELDAVLVERAMRASAPRERASWLRRSAALRDERLDDVAGAVQRAEEALALDPTDAATLARLARLYERCGRVADRARVVERQAAATHDVRERLALLVSAGDAWTRLGDRGKAEAAWIDALRLDPENPDALAAIADLHEAAREWSAALEALRRLAASPRAAGRAADAWFRIGRIRTSRNDAVAAEEAWRRALDVDPTHLGAIRALRASRSAAGDAAAVARLLEAEARSASDPAERARPLAELGALALARQDVDTARRWFTEAATADPTLLDAARPLAEIHLGRGEWDRAAPLLEVIVDRLSPDVDRREAARWWHRLGLAAEHLGDAPRALACQRRARDLDGASLPVLERLASLAEDAGALEDALSAHEAVLTHHRDGLTREERGAAHARVAALEERLGRPVRAIAALNEALTIDPAQRAARERLVSLLESRGDFRGALDHRRRIAESLAPEARVTALAEVAAICRDRLDDLPAAIEAAEAAARLAPADVAITDALVAMHLRAGQPRRAADALARLLAQPAIRAEPKRAARLALALGRLLRDRVRDGGGAARALESALEHDPMLGEALGELEALLGADRRWRDLERVYTGVLERMPRTTEARRARAVLWRALEALYANALRDDQAARTAAQVAASIEAGALASGGA